MIIYNLFPLLAGKFSDWEPHLVRASDLGFNWIFVNPVQSPGFSGSLYSVKDYFSFNPLLIDGNSSQTPKEQLQKTIKKAEERGLRVMVDLVINHCAVDSDIIKDHPAWFQWKKPGKISHPFAMENGKKIVWGDLAKYDHRNKKDGEGLYQFFFSIVEFLIEVGFKGFRCDAAYQVPRTLWKRLIKETKDKYPGIVFFAETLGCTPDETRKTADAGFDYIFNSSKWWDLNSPWLIEQYNLTRETAPSVSFPESHDTDRLCAELDGNINGMKQRYLFASLFSAGVMMPVGFEFGFRKKLHVVKTTPEDWENTQTDISEFIRNVNRIKETYTVFQEEAPTEILNSGNAEVLVMWKASISTADEALLILNKDINHNQVFQTKSLGDFMQATSPCSDVSPEFRLDYLPEPFTYELRPGQGIVLIASRDLPAED